MPLADSGYFNPATYKSSQLYYLPKPIGGLIIRDSWDARESKVPLKDGAASNGQSQNAVQIDVQGQVGFKDITDDIESADKFLTEVEMFDAIRTMRGELDTDDSTRFEFFVYHDSGSSTYRKFKNCWCRNLDFSVGNDVANLFTWNCSIIAEDPVIYTTAQGA